MNPRCPSCDAEIDPSFAIGGEGEVWDEPVAYDCTCGAPLNIVPTIAWAAVIDPDFDSADALRSELVDARYALASFSSSNRRTVRIEWLEREIARRRDVSR